MLLKINTVEIAAYPAEFSCTVLDLDDAESTERTANGSLNRDRVAVKRQVEMTFPPLPWPKMSKLLTQMRDSFFDFYYPDPMTGKYETKNMYVGNRPAPVALDGDDGELWWGQLSITLTER
ncbi:DUF6711 family protein [Paenibacillus paeoniae]|uniref:Phage tail protein n=1 Tax=Paenibacillus paeoniae TaxID=2292705 RepID=A0A371P207_9BACL|nr:DUF6711 family protein [Paenibacillus paeoniae]REK69346.1 hypothetical protein DX130_24610 [Paenibacillus paeoniae]